VVYLSWAVPQLFGARALRAISSRKWYIVRTALLGRIPLVLAIVSAAVFAEERPGLTVFLFLAGFGLFRLSSGLNNPAYYDLVATVINPRVRLRFIGLSQFLGGAVGALGLVAGRRVLDTFPFPLGFVVCFVIGIVFLTVALCFMAAVREPPLPPRAPPDLARPSLLRRVGETLRGDASLRRYLGGRILLAVGTMAGAFYAVQATRSLGASAGDVATFTAVLLVSQTVSTLLWGATADRIGLAPVLLASALLGAGAAGVALLAPSLVWFPLVFVFVGAGTGALAVTDAGLPMALAESSGADRGHYVALANTVVAPFQMAVPLVGGLLADAGGYGLTYGVSLVASLAAGGAVALAVPRARRQRRTSRVSP
jgi:MFS family permease